MNKLVWAMLIFIAASIFRLTFLDLYENRYRQMDVEVEGQKRTAHIRMPIIIGPKEQVILSEMGKEMRIE